MTLPRSIDEEVLDFISDYMDEYGIAPTVREIMSAVDISSESVQRILIRLENEEKIILGRSRKSRNIILIENKNAVKVRRYPTAKGVLRASTQRRMLLRQLPLTPSN